MPFEVRSARIEHDRRAVEAALVEVRVAFAHEGGYISATLRKLTEIVEAHSTGLMSSGTIEDIIDQAPRLAAHAATLVRDHEELSGILIDLRERLDALRDEAAEVCDRIVEHNRLGDRLAYEAFTTDMGGQG